MKGNETMENKYLWNDGWSFHRADADAEYAPALLAGWDFDPVDLPHDWLIYDSRRLYEDGTERSLPGSGTNQKEPFSPLRAYIWTVPFT